MYKVEKIIDRLISATTIVKSCRADLLKMGFSEAEADDIIQVYVHDALKKED